MMKHRILPRAAAAAVLLLGLAVAAPRAGGQAARPEPASRLNRMTALLETNRPAFGIFATSLSPRSAVSLGSSPLDFIIIDMEHSPFDPARLETFLLAMTNKRRILEKGSVQPDVIPLVRLPGNGREQFQFQIKQVLDVGAFGVVLPHINTAAEALAAVRAARFPQRRGVPDAEPAGLRGVGYGFAAHVWGLPADEYARRADLWPLDPAGEVLLVCMIESKEAVENLEAILAVPGIGGIFIGPSDLSFSLGVPESDPLVEENIRKILAACRRKGIPCGTLTGGGGVPERIRQGFRFLAVGSDSGLSSSVTAALEAGRKAAQ